mgnify:FL=1
MEKINEFAFCPACGKREAAYEDGRKWRCAACGFTLYNNTASAVGLIIPVKTEDGLSVLCIKRGREPRKGYYALPGGFTDPDESAEQACMRECREETGLTPVSLRYVCSAPNTYEYKHIVYKTCDLFFEALLPEPGHSDLNALHNLCALRAEDTDEIKGYKLFPVSKAESVDTIPLAFPSAAYALKTWIKEKKPI